MADSTSAASPGNTDYILTPYQRRWIEDRHRRKLFNKARRIGGSFAVALDAAMSAAGFTITRHRGQLVYRPDRGVNQRIVSASENQSKELLEQVRSHLVVLSEAVVGRALIDPKCDSAERVGLVNGARCYALAPSPRSVRGGAGDVILDEFAHMPRTREIWTAAKSITDPTLARPGGYRLRVVSTPFGDDNMFYELAEGAAGARFSKHTVDIHRAKEEGFPAENAEILQAESADLDDYRQEYECQFLSARERYISAELFDSCLIEPEEMPGRGAVAYAGNDVARKQSGDKSAIMELYKVGGTLYDGGLDTFRGKSWDDQEAIAGDVLGRTQAFAVDSTGIGNQYAERLHRRYGSRVMPVEFTLRSKEQVITGLRLAMEQGRLRLNARSPYAAQLRRAVLSIRREITAAGNVRYDAPRSDDPGKGKSHADEAWALALAVHAAGPADRREVPRITSWGRRAMSDLGSSM